MQRVKILLCILTCRICQAAIRPITIAVIERASEKLVLHRRSTPLESDLKNVRTRKYNGSAVILSGALVRSRSEYSPTVGTAWPLVRWTPNPDGRLCCHAA